MFIVQYLHIDSITDAYTEAVVKTKADAYAFILRNADSIQLIFDIYEVEDDALDNEY